jgi:hypothetical protein
MKIKKITKKKHDIPKKVYCFFEPVNHECIVVGKSGTEYASYQCFLFGGHYSLIFDEIAKWKSSEVEEYIVKNNLVLLTQNEKTLEEMQILTVCKDIHAKFFETYPKLTDWHQRELDHAGKYGYVDSVVGGRRHLSKLMYQGRHFDKKSWKNLSNISSNTIAQNVESMLVYKAMRNIYDDLNKYNMKTKIIGMVHDEITHFIYKPEAKDVYEIASKHMTIPTEVYGCPITAELGVGYIWGFDIEMTEKNAEKFQKGNFFNISYLTDTPEIKYYENIAYDLEDIKEEFIKKNPDAKIVDIVKTH